MLTVLKMFATATTIATNEAAASLDIPADCELWALNASVESIDAGGAAGRFELSLASANGLATNDTRSAIFTMAYAVPATGNVALNQAITFPDPIQLNANERLYIHYVNAAAFDTNTITVHLYVKQKTGSLSRGRRL